MGKLLTTTQAAARLGISAQRVQIFISEGRLPAQRVGHFYVIDEDDLKLVENRKTGRPPKASQVPKKRATVQKGVGKVSSAGKKGDVKK